MLNKILIIETTVATTEQAKSIAKTLLDKRVIACANISEIESIYNWGNKEQNEKEYKISCKTTNETKDKCIKLIQELHPYRVPMVLSKEVESNSEYFKWVEEKVKDASKIIL